MLRRTKDLVSRSKKVRALKRAVDFADAGRRSQLEEAKLRMYALIDGVQPSTNSRSGRWRWR